MLEGIIGVTISRNARDSAAVEEARELARQLDAVYVERVRSLQIEELLELHQLSALIVLEKSGPRIHSCAGSFAYHPGMAALRLQSLRRGQQEHLKEALDIREGSRILDCTLGLGADAIVAAFCAGASGKVVGLEASRLLHFAVEYGLRHYLTPDSEVNAAMRRITAVHTEAEAYLRQCAPDSFDAVYFDPMFRNPVQGSKSMEALRPLAYTLPLSRTAVALALRTAPRVVIKERNEYILQAYGCKSFVGGKYSRFKYGIITRNENSLLNEEAGFHG